MDQACGIASASLFCGTESEGKVSRDIYGAFLKKSLFFGRFLAGEGQFRYNIFVGRKNVFFEKRLSKPNIKMMMKEGE
ncbi:MAG: hypothetical protein ACI4AO_09940 [Anaerotignum sp.]